MKGVGSSADSLNEFDVGVLKLSPKLLNWFFVLPRVLSKGRFVRGSQDQYLTKLAIDARPERHQTYQGVWNV